MVDNKENQEIHDVQEGIKTLLEDYKVVLEEQGIDLKKDSFKVVQPYDDGNAITITLEEVDGERKAKILVNDTTFILPKKDGTLDIFSE